MRIGRTNPSSEDGQSRLHAGIGGRNLGSSNNHSIEYWREKMIYCVVCVLNRSWWTRWEYWVPVTGGPDVYILPSLDKEALLNTE